MCLIINSRCTTVWYYNMQPVVPDTRRPDGGSCCSHWTCVRLQLYDVKKKKIIKCIHWIKTMWAVVCCEYLEESSRPVWLWCLVCEEDDQQVSLCRWVRLSQSLAATCAGSFEAEAPARVSHTASETLGRGGGWTESRDRWRPKLRHCFSTLFSVL